MVFKERQSLRGTWVMYLLLMTEIPVLVVMAVLWHTGQFGDDGHWVFIAVVAIIIGVFWLLMSLELQIRIDKHSLSYRCPPFISWRTYRKEKISKIGVLEKGVMWKFGGLGIRYNFKKWAYVFSDEAAIEVETDGKSFVLSTREPEKVRRMIEEWKPN